MRRVAVLSMTMLAASLALAGFTVPTVPGPVNSDHAAGVAGNGIFTYAYGGPAFIPGQLTFSGLLTSGGVGSYLTEARWKITNPAGQSGLFQPIASGTTWTGQYTVNPVNAGGLQSIFTGNNVGTWTFEAYESYDDTGVDAWWNSVNFSFADYVAPQPSHWPGQVEGFETGVPPQNHPLNNGVWSQTMTAGHTQALFTTWYAQTGSAPEGTQYASVQYDYNQDEWMYSPNATAVPGMVLSGKTMGSPYWGRPPSEGGTFDNYDVQAWVIRGGAYGGGDDVMIAKLDDNWAGTTPYVWFNFSYGINSLLTLGESFRIGFRYVGNDGAQGAIDGVLLTPEPAAFLLLAVAGLALRRR